MTDAYLGYKKVSTTQILYLITHGSNYSDNQAEQKYNLGIMNSNGGGIGSANWKIRVKRPTLNWYLLVDIPRKTRETFNGWDKCGRFMIKFGIVI